MKIKDIKKEERPIERLLVHGAKTLSNEDLFAIVLNTGSKEKSAKDLALDIINLNNNLKDINKNQLLNIKGIKEKKAATILAVIELSCRINITGKNLINLKFTSAKIVHDYFYALLKDLKQEHFYCIYLDSANKIIEYKLLFVGTLNQSLVHPREIMKHAFLLSASSIICVHNHPSLKEEPSKDDLEFTIRIKEVCDLCGIRLLDHIIIGQDYYSFYEKNDII